jgi:single-strand DNA-binding protein
MLNRVMLIGRLGKDPEVRRLETGAAVARFSLATDESYKDKDGQLQQQTEWHNIICWRSQAELAEKFLKKGMLIFVDGKLSHREYMGQDNQKKYITEVVVSTFRMLERREGGGGSFPSASDEPVTYSGQRSEAAAMPVMADAGDPPPTDDLPF